jgi:hypothetical protein
MVNKDFIIVLAWPELMCKLPGSWYDFFFRKTGKVRGGHSAIILVNSRNKRLYYMDNGRYHSPIGYSRIRDEEYVRDSEMINIISKKIFDEDILDDKKRILSYMSDYDSKDLDIISYNIWLRNNL